PPRHEPAGISAQTLAERIDAFLASRGYRPPAASASATPPPQLSDGSPAQEAPLDFICEDDVRAAIRAGKKLVVGEKTIVTPAARDLGEAQRVFVHAGWPR
ncbi:MAG TPA: hypothetical protein VNI78_11890, partial [Vicinamibacterales bacterium]|nr:hypothetical protein [Vicinamibacterales bacterium]